MRKNRLQLLSFALGLIVFCLSFLISQTVEAASLSGRILLQVQDKGQAWYVDPVSVTRYYLGRPDDAFKIMRDFGLGVSNNDLSSFISTKAPTRLAGRIVLKVQDKGQAYYVNPLNLKLYYLGRPDDAFAVIRSLGLGITNSDLNKIAIGTTSASQTANLAPTSQTVYSETKTFTFKYKNTSQSLSLQLSPTIYKSYQAAPKVYSYPANNPPANLSESFYGLFLQIKKDDLSISDIVSSLSNKAKNNNWSDDELAESALALVQYITYDKAKADSSVNNPYYPYETLYLKTGVCSDKTFLAVSILRKLGYGAAIMNFPDINHSAAGIACPVEYSISGSGYCYVEVTNYFPISVVPNSIQGQAQVDDYSFDTLFDESKLGSIEIVQKSSGKIYYGASIVHQKVAEMSLLYNEIKSLRAGGSFDYQGAVDYNQKVSTFNDLVRKFYQQ